MYVLKNAIADKTEDVIYSPKEGQKPQYFMHVTAVDEDVFHMNVVADVPADCTRKLFIKDMNHLENTRIIKIKKGETSQGIDMVIRKSDPCKCRFAIYASRESAQPISNATQLQLTVLKDENEMPPKNMQYKPKCIDAAAAFQVKDVQNNQLNIYWSISPKAFGNISYKIVVNHREIAIISALPYYVPLSSVFSVFTSPFQVITVSEAEGFIYESNPSDPIYCHDLKKKEDEKEDEKVRESAETVKEEYDPYDLDEKAFGRFIIEKVNEKTANRLMQHLKTGKNKVCDDKVIKPKQIIIVLLLMCVLYLKYIEKTQKKEEIKVDKKRLKQSLMPSFNWMLENRFDMLNGLNTAEYKQLGNWLIEYYERPRNQSDILYWYETYL